MYARFQEGMSNGINYNSFTSSMCNSQLTELCLCRIMMTLIRQIIVAKTLEHSHSEGCLDWRRCQCVLLAW